MQMVYSLYICLYTLSIHGHGNRILNNNLFALNYT